MIQIQDLHHISIAVIDLESAKKFYGEVLGFSEIKRPNFDFPGAWYGIGSEHQLHLIVYSTSKTLRKDESIDTRDGHFAVRIKNYQETLTYLKDKGVPVIEKPNSKSGFSQIFCKDPDNNIIEFNIENHITITK